MAKWKYPTVYELEGLVRMISPEGGSVTAEVERGKWVPARPVGWAYFMTRLRCAWLAFKGECDLVRWPGGQ